MKTLAPISAQTGTDPGLDWRTQAAQPADHDGEDEAIAICWGCPVEADCLADAIKAESYRLTSGRHGIWGGKTPQQRYAMYRSQTRKSKGGNR